MGRSDGADMTGMKDRNGKRWSAWKRRTAAGLLAVLTALSGCGRTNLEAQEEENSFFAMNRNNLVEINVRLLISPGRYKHIANRNSTVIKS